MKKYLLLLFAFLPVALFGQGESNTWMFGICNSIHFNSSGPVYGGVPGTGIEAYNMPFYRSNAACDANGNLLFYVKMKGWNTALPPDTPDYVSKNIYNAVGEPMLNGDLVTAYPVKGPIQIVKKPGNNALYYVIYSLNFGLLSTTVDMTLNGGLGGVVAAEKGVILSGWQTIVGQKTVVVQGCDCIWLVVRSRTANEYKAYRITEAGIDPEPVISNCGLLPLIDYNLSTNIGPPGGVGSIAGPAQGFAGLLKASPDGRKIVACCQQGLELYDFSPCSGKVSHPRILDTAGSYQACFYGANSGYTCFDHVTVSYYSACFSPDNTKLYATYFYGRSVYQFDLSLSSTTAIMASKTAVLHNEPFLRGNIIDGCTIADTSGMGDLKLGPDGKIYIANNSGPGCALVPGFADSMTLHAINNPNLAGMACNPQLNALLLGNTTKYLTGVNFNPSIVMPPAPRDTVTSTMLVSLCFGGLLQTDTAGDCYHWNTGSDSSSAWADTSGQYIVCRSSDNCAYHIDTFTVHVVQLPQLFVATNSCVNAVNGLVYAQNTPGDSTTFNYAWKDANGGILQTASSNSADTFYAGPGHYLLQISTGAGCDTTLSFTVDALPVPGLPYLVDTAVCRGKYIQFNTSTDATETNWVFGDGDFSTEQNPLHAFGKTGVYYMAVVVTNASGCSDTADAEIRVNELNLELSVSPGVIEQGNEVELNTSADRNYSIVAWIPFDLFPEQNNKRQDLYPSETMVIRVQGISDQGCMDTASVTIYVKPEIRMPTAFSPNGDGLNDYFAPFADGKSYKVSTFRIFNRLGQLVYDGFGETAMKGWDGTYKGKPVDAGAYFYRIAVSTEYGELLKQKGDVTVVR